MSHKSRLKIEWPAWLTALAAPGRLQWTITAIVLAMGVFAIHGPLSDHGAVLAHQLAQEMRRGKLTKDITDLRAQLKQLESGVAASTDTSEWRSSVLQLLSGSNLTLVSLEPVESQRVGNYSAIQMRLQLQASYADLDQWLSTVERDNRRIRIDHLSLTPLPLDPRLLSVHLGLTRLAKVSP